MKYVIFKHYDILVKQHDDKLILIEANDFLQLANDIEVIYDDEDIKIAQLTATNNLKIEFQLVSIKPYLGYFEQKLIDKIIYYQQLTSYYNSDKYCNMCSNNLTRRDATKFLYCNNCQTEIYPQISPCVIVRIEKDNQILMSRSIGFTPNKWGLIAGFVEIGETLEDAVRREVMEEVGIEIEDIKYWGSQPWVFPNNTLIVAYTAKYKAGNIKIDYNELEEANFFTVDNIPGLPGSNISIAYKMIDEFIKKWN
jgi:NAD+ diphosphatase